MQYKNAEMRKIIEEEVLWGAKRASAQPVRRPI
jgi:hypothetical protein